MYITSRRTRQVRVVFEQCAEKDPKAKQICLSHKLIWNLVLTREMKNRMVYRTKTGSRLLNIPLLTWFIVNLCSWIYQTKHNFPAW